MDLAHRDLKLENVLMVSKNYIKVADFGFVRKCRDERGRRVMSDTFCGSVAYAAPEIILGTPYNPKKADVWSLGCILFIMLTGTMPFDESNVKEMVKMQTSKTLTFPTLAQSPISSAAKKLITDLLEPDVTKRPNIRKVKRNSWLQ
ncbi:testis-specific serine/threonine-protein kinase 1-like [Periplaneta americana]|uniref:testis-specific serine/threonine-protein kinase 1-like n=1 Tax=Periplaneta americana TaxID=6978 RepID=UPI0037E7BE70